MSDSGRPDVQKAKKKFLKTLADMLDDGVSLLIQVSIASYALRILSKQQARSIQSATICYL